MSASAEPGMDWAALYLRHRAAMYAAATAKLKGAAGVVTPDDVVMHAMDSVMSNPPTGVRNWEAFLVTVVNRRALDHFTSSYAKHTSPQPLSDFDNADPLADVENDVAEAIDRSHTYKVVLAVLGGRSAQHQTVLRMRLLQGRSGKDTALALGVSTARVSQLQREALELMRTDLNARGVEQ